MPYGPSDLLQHTLLSPLPARQELIWENRCLENMGPLFSVLAEFHLRLEGRGKNYFKSFLSSPYFMVGRGLASLLTGIKAP